MIEGGSTITGWNLLSSAASFSTYFRYSFRVVAPIVRSLPLARAGLSKFPASTAPSAAPAPTIVWSSSIKSITCPSEDSISLITAFNLSSNSPRYLVPAISAPRSRHRTRLFLRGSGTSPSIIFFASPSTIAVFPVPASPTSTGLFFVFLESICIILLISSSRPITGSSLPSDASRVKSCVYFSRDLYLDSGSGSVMRWFPRRFFSSISTELLSIPAISRACLSFSKERNKCSVETYSSRIFPASL